MEVFEEALSILDGFWVKTCIAMILILPFYGGGGGFHISEVRSNAGDLLPAPWNAKGPIRAALWETGTTKPQGCFLRQVMSRFVHI